VADQRFGGGLGALHRLASTAAGLLGSRDAPLRRALSPLYGHVLYALSRGRGVSSDLNGQTFYLDPRFRWFLQPDYEADLARVLRERMRPGQQVLDIGAHIGVYALQIARWTAPGGRVIAFEPNPGTAEVLRRHIRMNHLEAQVRVEAIAFGRRAGAGALFGVAGSGISRLSAPNPDDLQVRPATAVVVQTVDGYCAEHGVAPDWMLVDVEGYEFDVLAGALETIRRRGAALSIVVEIHPTLWPLAGWTRAAVDGLLTSIGRVPVPLTGQRDPLAEYGSIALAP
jgi:FkbM family methyltransferase